MEINDFNKELREQINSKLTALLKEIGNNRQQLTSKVLNLYRDINKELNKGVVDDHTGRRLQAEVAEMVRIASRQMPQLNMAHLKSAPSMPRPVAPKPAPAPSPPQALKTIEPAKAAAAKPKTAPPPKPAEPVKAKPEKKSPKPAVKKKAKSAPAKKKK